MKKTANRGCYVCGNPARIEQDVKVVGLLYKPNSDDERSGVPIVEDNAMPVNLLIARESNGQALNFCSQASQFEV